ncbi:cysteine--tRNA ligase [Candidatus Dependentiae bacterium]|nr:MAG: cysteine--tRNA ligase [Candidatus Dependentiae bacterium]
MLHITNTMTGKKQPVQANNKNLSLYVCGITPYASAHIGHGRCYISFDLLFRLLTFLQYKVTYCRNITDIDDKLLHAAEAKYGDKMRYQEIATYFFDQFKKQMSLLNIKNPTVEPRVTEHIQDIIAFIDVLIEKGHAYQIDGDVYFAINTYPAYGSLSGQKTEHMLAGARVEVNDKKKNPLDFVLWKGEQTGFWPSPWGNGRPGWHIECSAMAAHFFGDRLDIHAGGLDLIFPHHENEKAQSESRFGVSFADCWMHNGLVTVNHEKMSKSVGNFITLEEVTATYHPMVVRYYFLTFHYKAPAEFNNEGLDSAFKTYERLVQWASPVWNKNPSNITCSIMKKHSLTQKLLSALCDDLNTPAFLGILFENLKLITQDTQLHQTVVAFIQTVLGLDLAALPEKELVLTAEIKDLIAQREKARALKDWKKADALRELLLAKGYVVQDKKQ